MKVSYRTMPNMKQLVSSHNTRLIKQNDQKQQQQEVKKMCNCQKNADPCPLEGNCLVKGVVYQATVTETLSQRSKNYIGLTDTTFKERHRNHKKNSKMLNIERKQNFLSICGNLKSKKSNTQLNGKL